MSFLSHIKGNKDLAQALRGFGDMADEQQMDLYRYQRPAPDSGVRSGNPIQADNAMDFWRRRMMGLPFSGPFANATGAGNLRGLLG